MNLAFPDAQYLMTSWLFHMVIPYTQNRGQAEVYAAFYCVQKEGTEWKIICESGKERIESCIAGSTAMRYNNRDRTVQTIFRESHKGDTDGKNTHKGNYSCKRR